MRASTFLPPLRLRRETLPPRSPLPIVSYDHNQGDGLGEGGNGNPGMASLAEKPLEETTAAVPGLIHAPFAATDGDFNIVFCGVKAIWRHQKH